jgi:hypothetical protein
VIRRTGGEAAVKSRPRKKKGVRNAIKWQEGKAYLGDVVLSSTSLVRSRLLLSMMEAGTSVIDEGESDGWRWGVSVQKSVTRGK